MNNKLKAFTILEVLLSMIILSLIISLSYSLFSVLNKQMSLFETENTQEIDYNLFNSAIYRDTNNAIDFTFENNTLTLKNYNNTSIDYKFKNKYVLRQTNNTIDTLQVNIDSLELLKDKAGKSNQLQFRIRLLNEAFSANYFLNKSISNVINKKYFNEN